MSERNHFRRGKGGQKYRPSGGMRNKDKVERPAKGDQPVKVEEPDEEVFFSQPHEQEIESARMRAGGIVQAADSSQERAVASSSNHNNNNPRQSDRHAGKNGKRKPRDGQRKNDRGRLMEEPFSPVPVADLKEEGFVGNIRAAAGKMFQTVRKIIKPEKRPHKEIIINQESLETRIAILEEGRLEEFNIERAEDDRLAHSIFKGKVKNLEDGLKAAFVDIGFEKNAFLHYWDIVPNSFDKDNIEIVERNTKKKKERPKITQKDIPRLYPPNTPIVVQVTKGPIGSKGPRVTTNLAIPGRFLVLLPTSDQSGISRKIDNPAERNRLKKILKKLTIPEGMGVIIRTAGEGARARYFVRDLAMLVEEWVEIEKKIRGENAPCCVYQEPRLAQRTSRDFLTEEVERIVVDDKGLYEDMRSSITRISQRSAEKVKFYPESQSIFDRFNITRQLETTFSRQVPLKSGGYLVIDETEALVAIDVNTGRHKPNDQESTIKKVNLEAAEEVCRQLRLRNIGGLLIIDFIDMKLRRDRQDVYHKVRECLKRDKAKTHVLPISELGLMEMTRQRHSESVRASVYDDCTFCKGRGKMKSPLTMSVEIQRKLNEILKKRDRDESDFQLRIIVPTPVLERLKGEDERLLIEMEKKYYGKLSFREDASFHSEQYKIINVETNQEIFSSV